MQICSPALMSRQARTQGFSMPVWAGALGRKNAFGEHAWLKRHISATHEPPKSAAEKLSQLFDKLLVLNVPSMVFRPFFF